MRLSLFAPMFALLLSATTLAGASAPLTRQQQNSDLATLRSEYILKSPVFSDANRRAALVYIDGLLASKAELSPEQFLISCLTVSAFAQNGHDSVDIMGEAWFPARRLPFRTLWLADGMVVSRAGPRHADLLGATIERIGASTPAQLLLALRRVGGGPDQYNSWNLNWLIESAGMLHAMGLASTADSLTMSFRLRDGSHTTRAIDFVPGKEVPSGANAMRLWSAAPFAAETGANFLAAAPARKEPLYLQDPDTLYRSVPLPELKALYVQFRINMDFQGQQIKPFVDQLSRTLRSAPPSKLVLDLRMDIGGDNETTRELMRTIAQTVPGRIYLLVGPQTFSAGIASAAALKHDGGQRVTIVGAATGDRLQWWSENHSSLILPNSGYGLHINTGYWDLVHGCGGNSRCYSDKYDTRIPSLEPDLPAPLTIADWLNGRDPAMEAVRRHMQGAR